MDLYLQPEADELIRALGALGVAQERSPDSPETDALTRRAEQLRKSLAAAVVES